MTSVLVIWRRRIRAATVVLRWWIVRIVAHLHHRGAQGLSVCSIDDGLALRVDRAPVRSLLHAASVSQVRVRGMSWHERVRLGRHGSKDALLVEAKAVGASSIWRGVEAVATDLDGSAKSVHGSHSHRSHLSPTAVAAGDGSTLPRSRLAEVYLRLRRTLVVRLRIWHLMRLALIHIVGRVASVRIVLDVLWRWQSNHLAWLL